MHGCRSDTTGAGVESRTRTVASGTAPRAGSRARLSTRDPQPSACWLARYLCRIHIHGLLAVFQSYSATRAIEVCLVKLYKCQLPPPQHAVKEREKKGRRRRSYTTSCKFCHKLSSSSSAGKRTGTVLCEVLKCQWEWCGLMLLGSAKTTSISMCLHVS